MPFHRLVVPTYFGGLPGGYDYINNALVGTPSFADNAKVGGTNAGTYFVAFGEDATSSDFNRSANALAQNCDYLDDVVRRDLASPVKTSDVVAGAPVPSILLTGPGIFVGEGGTPNTVAGIRTFVQVVDENDSEIFDSAGAECQVTAISPETPGDGFSVGNITLTISPAIPTGKTYRVYYFVRSNLATFTSGVLQKAARRWNALPAIPVAAGAPHALVAGTSASQLAALFGFTNSASSVRTVTAATTLHLSSPFNRDGTLVLNPGASFNLQLPNPVTYVGMVAVLVNGTGTMSTANVVTLVRFAAEKINNIAANYLLDMPFGRWFIVSDGVDWHLLASLGSDDGVRTLTGAATLHSPSRDGTVVLDPAAAFNLQLPSPVLRAGQKVVLIAKNAGIVANPVTLVRFAAEKINDLAASYVLGAAFGRWLLVSDGTDWHVW